MDHQNQKTLSHQFTKSKFLKQVTKLLLSVSVFSLLFSHSTWFSLPIKLISHNLDKNYIFLLCNGLLVFLAKFSGLLSSSTSSSSSSSKHNNNLTNEYYNHFKHYEDDSLSERIVMETEDNSMNELQSGDQATQENADHQVVKEETEEVEQEEEAVEENKYVIEEEIKEPERDFNLLQEVEEEEERDEQNGMLSTEELNQKCEDFISKVKEKLRIEARQQQLVMV